MSSAQSQTFIQCFYLYLILSHTLTRQCSSGSNTRATAAPPDLCVTHSACLSFPSAFSPFSFPSNFNTHTRTYAHIHIYTLSSCLLNRKLKLESELAAQLWRVSWDDVQMSNLDKVLRRACSRLTMSLVTQLLLYYK